MSDSDTDYAAMAGLGPTPDMSGDVTTSQEIQHLADGRTVIDSTSADGTWTQESLAPDLLYHQVDYHPDHTVSVDSIGHGEATHLEVAHGMIESSHTDFYGGAGADNPDRAGEHVDRDPHAIPDIPQTDSWAIATSDDLTDL